MVGVFLGVVGLCLVSLVYKPHHHNFIATEVEQSGMERRSNGITTYKGDVTRVLRVCSCGEFKHDEVDGKFSLQAFQAPLPKDKDNELTQLRKMAGFEGPKQWEGKNDQ